MSCHSERLKAAGLVLEGLATDDVGRHADVWEKVVRKLRVGAMPPVGSPRPDVAQYKTTIAGIEKALDLGEAAAAGKGRTPISRLNRQQYTNAIRDLFGLDIDGRSMLPGDDTGFGFDNIADLLKMSPSLLDRYLIASNKISRLVVGDPTMKPGQVSYSLPRALSQDQRMGENLPFGSRGGAAIAHVFPLDGEYVFRITPNANGGGARAVLDVRIDRRLVKQLAVGGRRRGPADDDADNPPPVDATEARVPIKAGSHVVSVHFHDDVKEVEGVGVSALPLGSGYGGRTSPAGLGTLDIVGPFAGQTGTESPVYKRVFVCTPATAGEETPCAQKILRTLARRAYRRPATTAEIGELMEFYRRGRAEGTFQAGIQSAVARALMDVNFLFRIERDARKGVAPGVAYRVNDFELAQRLSFFLWSSIPDDTLLNLAERGMLRGPGVLEQQVSRMLRDPKAAALSTFFGQWLTVADLEGVRPDVNVFPDFNESLRQAFGEETRLFLEAQLREDRSAFELLTANYTFVNERLASFYGIPGVSGTHFRRVSLPDGARAGLMGQGSLLTVTSYPDRTSVVVRGKWILENLLSVPPPPPPPDVPLLDATVVKGTLRQRMESHRRNPVCATCHNSIDPLGFALEHFDGIGKFRARDAGAPIDASGLFLDGSKFAGAQALRQILANYQEAFLATAVEKMMTYALGRGVETSDMPATRRIIRDSAAHNHRWSSIILGIVSSQPFQMRRAS